MGTPEIVTLVIALAGMHVAAVWGIKELVKGKEK